MRLINVDTLELEEYFGKPVRSYFDGPVPRYVILSHRWSGEEITYKDFVKGRRKDAAGYDKVVRFCEQIRLRTTGQCWRIRHAWIDTVCIDKGSSAELSEAINSMWQYYEEAEMCYVYLSDVAFPANTAAETSATGQAQDVAIDMVLLEDFPRSAQDEYQVMKQRDGLLPARNFLHEYLKKWRLRVGPQMALKKDEKRASAAEKMEFQSHEEEMLDVMSFRKSVWFRRGWTLQELLAPRCHLFLTKDWNAIGRSGRYTGVEHIIEIRTPQTFHVVSRKTLERSISEATKIDKDFLHYKDRGRIHSATVMERMTWLAGRQTTRVEDIAYCALGIFGVHIPLLYGEGENAFKRLQEEIIRISDDNSIFAWSTGDPPLWGSPSTYRLYPMLAESPADFKGDSVTFERARRNSNQYAVTNRGVEYRLARGSASIFTCPFAPERYSALGFLVPLTCVDFDEPYVIAVAEQSCGHFDRQNCDSTRAQGLVKDSRHQLQEDRTIYIHTPLQRRICQEKWLLHEKGRHFVFETFQYTPRPSSPPSTLATEPPRRKFTDSSMIESPISIAECWALAEANWPRRSRP